MSNNIFFYWIFISQIILISMYYPRKVIQRMNQLQETYPTDEFPKLYTQPVKQFNRIKQLFMLLNILVLVFGMGIVIHLYNHQLVLSSNQITGYLLLQFLPLLLLEIFEAKQLKLMRAANSKKVKQASMTRRKLFDFVSPKMAFSAVVLYVALFTITLYIEGIHAPWYSGYGNLVAITYTNIFLMGIVFWVLFGKKQNPYTKGKDRHIEMKTIINVMFFTSIGASLYTIISVTINQFEHLVYIQPIISSVYCQILAGFGIGYMLSSIKITGVDFSVYKAD